MTVRLRCDGRSCGAVRQGSPGETIRELRARLATVGWAAVINTVVDVQAPNRRRNVIRDFCPPCAGRGRLAVAADLATAGATR